MMLMINWAMLELSYHFRLVLERDPLQFGVIVGLFCGVAVGSELLLTGFMLSRDTLLLGRSKLTFPTVSWVDFLLVHCFRFHWVRLQVRSPLQMVSRDLNAAAEC